MIDAYPKIGSCQRTIKEQIVANNLPIGKKALILSLLTEGQSVRATSRIADVSQPTILKLLVEAGQRARDFHDTMMQNLRANFVQVDEIWSYVGCKQKKAQENDPRRGDFYTFIALDAETKLVPAYRVGKRTGRLAASFMMELAVRIPSRFQLSTDAFSGYWDAIDRVWGSDIDYAQIHKDYAEDARGEKRYSPARIVRVTKKVLLGEPQIKHISTSYVERQNLTVRMQSRRFTRLTNAFSKKVQNLEAAVDLHFFFYNFIRIHQSLKVTPAMEAGITKKLWNWEMLLTWDKTADQLAA